MNNHEILFFTETWFSKGSELNTEGYKSFHCIRSKLIKKQNPPGVVSLFTLKKTYCKWLYYC